MMAMENAIYIYVYIYIRLSHWNMFPLGFPSANRTGLFIRCIFMDADISELNMFVVFDYLALEQKQPNLFPQIMFLYRLNS